MQEILDKMDKMKIQATKKLDNIYQMILVQRRRKRLRELQKKKDGSGALKTPAVKLDSEADKDDQTDHRRRLRRNPFKSNKFSRNLFQMPRGLEMNQQGMYNFGRIAEQEQNFGSLVDPSLTQRPQQP